MKKMVRKERPDDCCVCGHQKWLHDKDGTCIAHNFDCRCQGYKVDFWWNEEFIEIEVNDPIEVNTNKKEYDSAQQAEDINL